MICCMCVQTQVCVQQTALDLVAKGYDVHVVADGVSSRTQVDRMFALEVSTYKCYYYIPPITVNSKCGHIQVCTVCTVAL